MEPNLTVARDAAARNAGVLLDFDADDLCSDLPAAALRGERLAETLDAR